MDSFAWLKEAIDKIESKLDRLDQRLDDQNSTLDKQSVVLEDHTRRSLAAEENLLMLRSEMHTDQTHIEQRLKPVEKHIDRVEFVFKIIGFGAVVIGILASVAKIIEVVLRLF